MVRQLNLQRAMLSEIENNGAWIRGTIKRAYIHAHVKQVEHKNKITLCAYPSSRINLKCECS